VFVCGSRWLSARRAGESRGDGPDALGEDVAEPGPAAHTLLRNLAGLGGGALLVPWIAAEGGRALTRDGFIAGVAVLAIVAAGIPAKGDRGTGSSSSSTA
jgi:hypothetical protein